MAEMRLIKGLTKAEYCAKYYQDNKATIHAQKRERQNKNIKARMQVVLNASRQRSKQQKRENTLTRDFLVALWEEQKGVCALTGEEMSVITEANKWCSNTVSLDRINSDVGYIPENVWLVTTKVNYAKNCMPLDQFVSMCKNVVEVQNG